MCIRDRFSGGLYSFKARDYAAARKAYSKELIEGIEIAANIFGVNPYKLYTVDVYKRHRLKRTEKS